MSDHLTPDQFHASEGTADWRVLSEGATAYFRTGSIASGARFAAAIGALSGIDASGRQVDLRPHGVTVRLLSRSAEYFGITTDELELSLAISAIAREQGLTADPSAVQTMLIVPGVPDARSVMPFWRALLGYVPRPDSPEEDLVDPLEFNPGFWFEGMEQPRGDGGGAIHLAVWLPPELAQARVDAALAAGGRLVRDAEAPAWWTLADSAGNEADVSTTTGRG
ncbi:MAG: VOC family protein [Candidatus Limnocylindrales bacterium]